MTKSGRLGSVAVVAATTLLSLALLLVVVRSANAAFPGSNGRIAFDTDPPNATSTEIYTVGSGGQGLSALTENTVSDIDASFSADGQKVAFASGRGGDYDIYAIAANTPEGGANPAVRLTTGAASDQHPTFSPDGSRIAFTRFRADGSGSDIYVKNTDGSGSATLLADVAAWETDPEWSPDGGSVAFTSASDDFLSDAVIYTTDAFGVGALLRITGSGETARQPSWSPDGRQIAYTRGGVSDKRGNLVLADSGVYRIPSDGTGAPVPVVNPSVSEEQEIYADTPAWSPDGRQIAFVRSRLDRVTLEWQTDIYRINADGSGAPTYVTAVRPGIDDPGLDWQPIVPLFVWPQDALTIDWRDVLTIPGRLFFGPGNPMPGQRVYLEERPAGSEKFSLTPGAEAITAEDGTFRFEKVGPSENTDYRVRFEGDEAKGTLPATSSTRRVNVRVLVSERLSTDGLKLGDTVTVSGAVAPAHEGDVTLIIRRDGKAWAEKSVALQDSRYSLRCKPDAVGKYTVFARYPTHSDHLGNTSPKRSFVVR